MRFTPDRIRKLSDIMAGLGHVFTASIVLPALIDRFDAVLFMLGLTLSLFLFTLSVFSSDPES